MFAGDSGSLDFAGVDRKFGFPAGLMGYSVRMPQENSRRKYILRLAVLVEGGLLLLAVLLGWLLGHPPAAQVSFRWQTLGLAVVATLPLLLALDLCSRIAWKPLTRLFREVERDLTPLFARCSLLELAVISILAGIAEESLFRGVLQTALADWLHPSLALVAASVLFGLGHCITPAYVFLASAVGLYLGWLLMMSGNLLVPIIVHALYDFLALAYLVRKHK